MNPVLVTGAAGFVGSHLVDALLARGVPVRALVRPETDRRWLDPARVEFALGDVGDPSGEDALVRAASGCDPVYHVAGITQARTKGAFTRVNAEGAGRMLEPEQILREIPLARVGGDDDLKGIAVLLASDASNFMTGAVIPIDGGSTAW